MPSAVYRLFEIILLELDRDAHRERVVSKRIEANEEICFEVDADNDRGVDTRNVEPEPMLVLEPRRFAPVSNLEPMLVGRTALNRRRVASERIAEDADALVVRALDPEVDRGSIGRTHVEDLAACPLDGRSQEGVDISSPRDAVHLGV
jgi:hypothetical protein